MRLHACLLIASLSLLASCRARQGTQSIVADPFLSGRATVPPPPTATVTPLGTIQPLDTTTPALPPGVSVPATPAAVPATTIQPVYPPGTSGTMSTPPNNESGVRFAGGAVSDSGGVKTAGGFVEPGQVTAAGWVTPVIGSKPAANAPATDILNLPPARR